jgi:Alpha/beta hydrolase domain
MKHSIPSLALACTLTGGVVLSGLWAPAQATTLTDSGSGYANANPFDLAPYGAYEEEFFFEGKANTYMADGKWGTDGKVKIKVKRAEQPYKTRLLVRAPINPARFNGTVIVEWFNVSSGYDVEVDAAQGREELLRNGYAWVGVSAQSAGISGLKRTKKGRYDSLAIASDTMSYDIFSDAGRAVREQYDTLLKGLKPQRVIAAGQSQSAIRLTTYTNAIQPVHQVYDGMLINSRAASGAGLDTAFGGPSTAYIRNDLTIPVFQLMTETDLPIWKAARQPDTDRLRTWEVAGAAHIDAYLLDVGNTASARDLGFKPVKCRKPVNAMPFYRVVKSVIRHLDRWVADGTLPPTAPGPITLSGSSAAKDAYGNAKGGVRLPEIVAPLYSYGATNSGSIFDGPPLINPMLCALAGSQAPLTSTQIKALYSSKVAYLSAYSAAATAAAQAGYILGEDAVEGIAKASAAALVLPLP